MKPGFLMREPSIFRITLSTHRPRSEEHTSELQSPDQLVCRLLLEKKNSMKSKTLLLTGTSSGLGKTAARLFANSVGDVIATMPHPDAQAALPANSHLFHMRLACHH